MEYPFEQKNNNDGSFNRTFKPNVEFDDLQWHFDEQDRIVKPLNENDWKIQFDNQLPMPINQEILIPKGVYHRVIKGTTDLNVNITEVHWDSGLGKWLKEKWVDISRKDKSGKHPPCGASAGKGSRKSDQKKAYPKCRPAKKAASMSKKEKKRATEQKRRVERKTPHHQGRKPNWVSHIKENFSFSKFMEEMDVPPPVPAEIKKQEKAPMGAGLQIKLNKEASKSNLGDYVISGNLAVNGINITPKLLFYEIKTKIQDRIFREVYSSEQIIFDKETKEHLKMHRIEKDNYSDCKIEIKGVGEFNFSKEDANLMNALQKIINDNKPVQFKFSIPLFRI